MLSPSSLWHIIWKVDIIKLRYNISARGKNMFSNLSRCAVKLCLNMFFFSSAQMFSLSGVKGVAVYAETARWTLYKAKEGWDGKGLWSRRVLYLAEGKKLLVVALRDVNHQVLCTLWKLPRKQTWKGNTVTKKIFMKKREGKKPRPGHPEKTVKGGTTVSGGRTVLSKILQQSFSTQRRPWQQHDKR